VNKETDGGQGAIRKSLKDLASKVERAKSSRSGDVVFRLSGSGAGTFCLRSGRGKTEVIESPEASQQVLIEVMGDAEKVQAVLDGRVDAREQFLDGGIRVRGDLQHLSDLATELGLMKHPL
jgi:hypothetical protein